MQEIQSSIVPMPANAGSMLRNPKAVYTLGPSMVCLATDGKMWLCHRRQKGSEGYPICYEITDKHSRYEEYKAQLAKEDSVLVTIQVMDDDEWAPRQDLDLIPPRMLKEIVEYLIENRSYVKSEGDARALMTTMTKAELLDAWLTWNGICGWTDAIIMAVNGIEHAKQGFKPE